MRAEIIAKIEKWQEPPPAKTIKPLPAPDHEVKKKRGGKRHRLMKERYGMTEMRKQANRINFNVPEEEIGLTGEGMGMIGQGGSGRVRVAAGNTKKLQKDAQKARGRALGGAERQRAAGCVSCARSVASRTNPLPSINPLTPERSVSLPSRLSPLLLSAAPGEEVRQQRRRERPLVVARLHPNPGYRARKPKPGAGTTAERGADSGTAGCPCIPACGSQERCDAMLVASECSLRFPQPRLALTRCFLSSLSPQRAEQDVAGDGKRDGFRVLGVPRVFEGAAAAQAVRRSRRSRSVVVTAAHTQAAPIACSCCMQQRRRAAAATTAATGSFRWRRRPR